MHEQHFQKTRPYLYHLTHETNLAYIRKTIQLSPAATLMEIAGRRDLLRTRRRVHVRICVNGADIVLRDQAPLHKGSIAFTDQYDFEKFVESLNRRVFFWPGTATGPISYGVRHFERYREERPVILRVLTKSLFALNATLQPLYCHYNSGSPRCSYGVKSPRGTSTFVAAENFTGTPGKVVELTFSGPVTLPEDTQIGRHPSGPWRDLTVDPAIGT